MLSAVWFETQSLNQINTGSDLEDVWEYDNGCFLKCFLFKNTLKYFFKKIIFDINTLKWPKNINLKKN